MSNAYRIPKREVPAEVTVVGRPAAPLKIFLSEQARDHEGYERPSDMLNGIDTFFPAVDRNGNVILLQRDFVAVVSVPADYETDVEGVLVETSGPRALTIKAIEVLMEDGTVLKGDVEYVLPDGRRRLQDFLNVGERFVTLREGGTIHLINKLRIVRVTAA